MVAPRTVKYQDADYDTFRSALLINPTIPVMDPEQPGKYTDAVSGILRRLPHRKRLSVKTVTTDLSSAMMLTVRKVFPAAKLINDRCHVQQIISEAVDQLTIRYTLKVLVAENQAIRENRQKKKETKSKAERERIGNGSLKEWRTEKPCHR